jgi:signal transduction histidine kinase
MLWVLVGYLLGKALWQVALVATHRQLAAQQEAFARFIRYLHADVKSRIAAVRTVLPAHEADLRDRLDDLEDAVGAHRVDALLSADQVPVADLLHERVRTFLGAIRFAATPKVGALTVPRPVAIVIGQALGDLLSNAVKHGATTVSIDFDYDDVRATLTVDDDGPGFPDAVLEDGSKSLHRLRESARGLGGDLRKSVGALGGTSMVVQVPINRRSAPP